MRHFLLVLLLAFAILAGTISGARADGVAFPPANCSAAQPFMSFNGPVNNNNTYCSDGQFILKNAMPNCAEAQEVAFSHGKFICQDDPLSKMPTCGQDRVLTYNGTDFICVPRTDKIPTCGPNKFLTYNGTQFICADDSHPLVPNCGAGQQVVTGNGSQIYCVDTPPSGTYASCTKWCSNGFCVATQAETYHDPSYQPIAVHHAVMAALYDNVQACTAARQCDNGTWQPATCHP
jgi:hypothetical protein